MSVDPFSEPISKLSDAVIYVAQTTANFKPQLKQLKSTLDRIDPIIADINNLNRKLDRTQQQSDMFIEEIHEAKKLVLKCLKIKKNFFKRFTHSLKLKDANGKLLSFFQVEVQADQSRDIKQTLAEVNYVSDRITNISLDVKNLGQMMSSGSISVSSIRGESGSIERGKLGWPVPGLPRCIVAFKDPLENLKDKILADVDVVDDDDDASAMDIDNDDGYSVGVSKVVVVSAAGGCGKTTLVKMLCNDGQIREKFGENIFFVTVSETPNFMMVKCCKSHPLTLSVVGSSLDGKDETVWRHMLRVLSQGHSVLDLNEEILNRLERSFEALDDKFKQCYLDFGLFLEDQRIPATALLNMWAHLYNHDDEGIDTLAKICELSYRNLVNLVTTGLRKDPNANVNYCEQQNYCDQQFVTQHDLLRQLAINLSSKLPIPQRPRLIISEQQDRLVTNVQGQDMPALIENVQQPLQARILSISTGESFSKWCNLKVPNAEVMVLNLMSKTYLLPDFFNQLQKMKILNITNYGLYPTEFKNPHFLGSLSNLSRIRLERVDISSLSPSIFALLNLQKVSFIMCKIGNSFENISIDHKTNVWPKVVEIEMDYCQDLVEFPEIMCNSVYLKRLSITNCNEMCEISEEFGNLISLETLSLRCCTKLENLPESMARLEKLSIIDVSDCINLSGLPEDIGKLRGLRAIYMKSCTEIQFPSSVKDLMNTQVVCNDEIAYRLEEFSNLKVHVVEEDRLETLMRIMI